jgi:biotin--protein ligase
MVVMTLPGWESCQQATNGQCTAGHVNFDPTSVDILCEVASDNDQSRCGNLVQLESLCQLLMRTTAPSPLQLVVRCAHNDLYWLVESFVNNRLLGPDGHGVTSLTTLSLSTISDLSPSGTTDHSVRSGQLPHNAADHSSNVDGQDCCSVDGGQSIDQLLEPLAPPVERCANLRSKPPNVLIYCGKKDSSRLFDSVKSVLSQSINTDRYTIYHLKHDTVRTTPWCDNTALLVIASDKVYDGVDHCFLDYFLHGGIVISFGSAFDSLIVHREARPPGGTGSTPATGLGIVTLRCSGQDNVAVICGRYCYVEEKSGETMRTRHLPEGLLPDVRLSCIGRDVKSGQCVIVEATHTISGGVAILSQAHLDKDPVELAISTEVFTMLKQSNVYRFQILTSLLTRLGVDCDKPAALPLTAVCLLASSQDKKSLFLDSVLPRLHDNRLVSKDLTLTFLPPVDAIGDKLPPVTMSNIPVVTGSDPGIVSRFDSASYWRNLKTKVLGNVVMFADVITTTMNVFDGLMFSCPPDVGLVAIARQQVSGQGRGGNAWLSPDGCAMFSVHVRVPLGSNLGEHVTYLQHLMALAVVLAIRHKPGCESVNMRIKWPNDIYFGHDIKLGGVIVKSSVMHDVIHANIGCGVNVTNKDPTICINDLLGQVKGPRPDPFTVDEVIARSLTILEQLISDFQTNGRHSFLDQYYKYWLHSECNVRLGSDDGAEAKIVGLDDFGFLQVKLTDGNTVSVQPDGNSFDMMKNLIVPKSR